MHDFDWLNTRVEQQLDINFSFPECRKKATNLVRLQNWIIQMS